MAEYKGLDGLITTPLEIDFDIKSNPCPKVVVVSFPPPGAFKVVNIFVDSEGKIKVEFDDTPIL